MSHLPLRTLGAGWMACALLGSPAFLSPALAAHVPPASPLAPGLLFGLAILGPVLVLAAACAAGLVADILQRSNER